MSQTPLKAYLHKLSHIFGQEAMENELADIYIDEAYEQQDQKRADELVAKAVSLSPARTYLRFARYHRGRRQFDSAVDLYLKAFDANPENRAAWYEIGEFMLRHADVNTIRRFYNRLYEIEPSNSEHRFVLECYDYYEKLIEAITASVNKAKSDRQKLLINWSFWGDRYSDLLCQYHLPALLASGNLPAIVHEYDIHCIMVSSKERISALSAHPIIQKLKQFATLHLFAYPVEIFDFVMHHQRRTAGWAIPSGLITNSVHYATLETARTSGALALTLWPDHIIPANLLSQTAGALEDHVDLVAGPTFRLHDDPDLLTLVDARYKWPDGRVEIPCADMIKMLMKFLPDANYVDSGKFSTFPIYLCWRVGDEGIIASVNHCSPWLVRGEKLKKAVQLHIDPTDGFCFTRYLDIENNVAFLPDEVICFDLGGNPTLSDSAENAFSETAVAEWLSAYYTPLHEKYLQHLVLLKGSPAITEPRWRQTASAALQSLDSISSRIHQQIAK